MKNFLTIIEYITDILKDDSNKLNAIYYLWKRNHWMLDIRYLTNYFSKIPINAPIFLLGNQGDGLTLVSRILRRNPKIINITGNSKYWSGADEMVTVCEPILGSVFSGLLFNNPYHKKIPPPYSWSHACNDLINFYRRTEEDANEKNKKKIKAVIGMALVHHGKHVINPRFIDKSQLFSVKMSFINKLLEDYNPYFIHITRNPFATIYRAAESGNVKDMRRARTFLSLEDRFQICLEHWTNVAKSIEDDEKKVNNFLRIKIEDFLKDPEILIKKICQFLKLEFNKDMLPQPHQKIPFGVRDDKKEWYPLKQNINKTYLKSIPNHFIKTIQENCGYYARKFGYDPPK